MTGLPAPVLLAMLGTALLAVAVFAPRRVPASGGAVSLAPPLSPMPVAHWAPPRDADPFPSEPPAARLASWPALVDRRADGCDAAARLALVDALVRVRSPWADEVLGRAYDDEPDDEVRGAIRRALGGQVASAYPASPDSSAS